MINRTYRTAKITFAEYLLFLEYTLVRFSRQVEANVLDFEQTTINDIQQQMNEHYQKNTTLREENMELTTKLKGLIEQYELREQVS